MTTCKTPKTSTRLSALRSYPRTVSDDGVVTLELASGREVKLNYEDFDALLESGVTSIYHIGKDGYLTVARGAKKGGLLHHEILGGAAQDALNSGRVIDHINGDPSDNRRANLRFVTTAQNIQKRKLRLDAGIVIRGNSVTVSIGANPNKIVRVFPLEKIDAAKEWNRETRAAINARRLGGTSTVPTTPLPTTGKPNRIHARYRVNGIQCLDPDRGVHFDRGLNRWTLNINGKQVTFATEDEATQCNQVWRELENAKRLHQGGLRGIAYQAKLDAAAAKKAVSHA